MHRKEFWQRHTVCETDVQCVQLHREYHAQYVTPTIVALVRRLIGEKELRASTDTHLNDIPLRRWDAIVASGLIPYDVVSKLVANGDWLSLGTGVCILKEAARQIQEGKV